MWDSPFNWLFHKIFLIEFFTPPMKCVGKLWKKHRILTNLSAFYIFNVEIWPQWYYDVKSVSCCKYWRIFLTIWIGKRRHVFIIYYFLLFCIGWKIYQFGRPILKGLPHEIFLIISGSRKINGYFLCDLWWFWIFYCFVIFLFKNKEHLANPFLICRLCTSCQLL